MAAPTVPATVWVRGASEVIAKVTVAVAEPVPSVPVIVTVEDDAAVGVPEITPVDDEIDKPAGNVPDVTE
jgi:hypothetical protein